MGNSQESHHNFAYRVLTLLPGSPGAVSGLRPYLDFILYNPDDNDGELFSEYLFRQLTLEITLKVYDLISQTVREVQVKPMKLSNCANYLGAELRFECFEYAHFYTFLLD